MVDTDTGAGLDQSMYHVCITCEFQKWIHSFGAGLQEACIERQFSSDVMGERLNIHSDILGLWGEEPWSGCTPILSHLAIWSVYSGPDER